MSGYKYMCRLCKSFLSKNDPKLYSKYEECKCLTGCKFNNYIEHFEKEQQLKKIYDFWNKSDYVTPNIEKK